MAHNEKKQHRRRQLANTSHLAYTATDSSNNAALSSAAAQPKYTKSFPALKQVEQEPVFLYALTTSHPDSVLRRLGIIHQRGVFKGYGVYFNPKTSLWHRVDNDQPPPNMPIPVWITRRADKAPLGVIQIFGDDRAFADDDSFGVGAPSSATAAGGTAPTTPVVAGDAAFTPQHHGATNQSGPEGSGEGTNGILEGHQRNLRTMTNYHKQLVNPTDEGMDADDNVKLDVEHQRSFLRQYLARALPAAAVRTDAVIVLPHGNSLIAEQVGLGVASLQLSKTQVSATANVVDVVAVTPYRDAPIRPLCSGITHHLVLRRSMLSRCPVDDPALETNCRGWLTEMEQSADTNSALSPSSSVNEFKPSGSGDLVSAGGDYDPELDDANAAAPVCAFCGDLKEWHLPYDIYHAYCHDRLERTRAMQLHNAAFLSAHYANVKSGNKQVSNQASPTLVKAESMVTFDKLADVEPLFGSDAPRTPRQTAAGFGFDHNGKKIDLATEEPTAAELDLFVSRMVDQLAVGNRVDLHIPGRRDHVAASFASSLLEYHNSNVPERPSVPVVVILFGGDHHSARRYLTQCLSRRYTILVVVGSGGYADYLWRIRNRIERAFPFGGRDSIRRYSTALDPLTSEILSNFDLVRFIRRGAKNEELVRQIEGALKGDSALHNAWSTYAQYAHNSRIQAWLFTWMNMLLMLLSLLVTFLTVLQSFLLLRMAKAGEPTPPTVPQSEDYRGVGFLWRWTLMQWSVIVLPIITAALQASMAKSDFGGKWIALRTTSQRLLSEIYQYRTSCLLYKDDEVEKHRVAKNPDDLVYNSKEDLLQQRAHELTEQLLRGSCRQLKLAQHSGSVPPRSILAVDDGFSALTPDQYVRVRLRRTIDMYERDADYFTRLSQWCQNLITVTNGIGTGLAAIAAYTDGTLQSWLALTTAIVATLLRTLEGFRLEFQSRKKVESARNLNNIGAWWGSLQERADTKQNRDWLVEQVETVILDEVDAWAQQFGQALANLKGSNDKGSGEGGNGDGDRQDNDAAAAAAASQLLSDNVSLKELEFEELSVESLMRTLMDPSVPPKQKAETSKKIRELKLKLTSGGESGKPKSAKERQEADLRRIQQKAEREHKEMVEQQTNRGHAVSVMSSILFVGLGDGDRLPKALEDIITGRSLRFLEGLSAGGDSASSGLARRQTMPADIHQRRLIYREKIANAKNISFHECYTALLHFPELAPFLPTMSYRHVLEVCKRIVCENLFEETKKRLQRVKLRGLCAPETTTEDIISQFASIALTPSIDQFGLNGVIMLIRDPVLRTNLARLPDSETFFVELVACCLSLFQPNELLFVLYDRFCRMIAEVDVDVLMDDIENGVAMAKGVDNLARYGIRPWVLQRDDLLNLFPKPTRETIQNRSFYQLASYIDQVLSSKPSLTSVRLLTGKHGAAMFTAPLLEFLKESSEHQVLFAAAAESLSQMDILTLPRNVLLRKMELSQSETLSRLMSKLPIINLRLALSALQTVHSNTFGAALVDRACDSIVAFSLRGILNYENIVCLVAKLSELRVSFLKERGNSKASLLRLFGFPKLTRALDSLSEVQLKEMFYAFQDASCTDWTVLQAGITIRRFLEEKLQSFDSATMPSKSRRKTTTEVYKKMKKRAQSAFGLGESDDEDDDEEDDTDDVFGNDDYNERMPGEEDYPRARPKKGHQTSAEAVHAAKKKKTVKKPKSRPPADDAIPENAYDQDWIQEMFTWTGKTISRLMWVSASTPSKLFRPMTSAKARGSQARGDGTEGAESLASARTIHTTLKATLAEAPDQVVYQALSLFQPHDARELLYRLQPLGVEADVSRLFGNVLSQGGYRQKDIDVIEDACRSWEVRQAFVEALASMLEDRSVDVFELKSALFVEKLQHASFAVEKVWAIADCDHPVQLPNEPILLDVQDAQSVRHPTVALRESFLLLLKCDADSERINVLYDFFFNVLTELRHSAPLLLFYRLAAACQFVDLRELFDTVELRIDLVTLLTLMISDAAHDAAAAAAAAVNKSMSPTRHQPPSSFSVAGSSAAARSATKIAATKRMRLAQQQSVDLNTDESVTDDKLFGAVHPEDKDFSLFGSRIFADFDSVDCKVMGLVGGPDDEMLPRNFWKNRVMQTLTKRYQATQSSQFTSRGSTTPPASGATLDLSALGDAFAMGDKYDYGKTISILFRFSEPLLRYVFECQSRVLQSTIGRFFLRLVTYKRFNGREQQMFPLLRRLSLRQSFAFDVAVQNLIRCAKIEPEDFTVTLDHLEVDKFALRNENDRRAALSKWMSAGSGEPLDLLVYASGFLRHRNDEAGAESLASPRLSRLPTPTPNPHDGLSSIMTPASSDGPAGGSRQHPQQQRTSSDPTRKSERETALQKKKFFRYVFQMLRVALPDDDQNPLEKFTYAYESRLTQTMTGHVSFKAISDAQLFGLKLKAAMSKGKGPGAFEAFATPPASDLDPSIGSASRAESALIGMEDDGVTSTDARRPTAAGQQHPDAKSALKAKLSKVRHNVAQSPTLSQQSADPPSSLLPAVGESPGKVAESSAFARRPSPDVSSSSASASLGIHSPIVDDEAPLVRALDERRASSSPQPRVDPMMLATISTSGLGGEVRHSTASRHDNVVVAHDSDFDAVIVGAAQHGRSEDIEDDADGIGLE